MITMAPRAGWDAGSDGTRRMAIRDSAAIAPTGMLVSEHIEDQSVDPTSNKGYSKKYRGTPRQGMAVVLMSRGCLQHADVDHVELDVNSPESRAEKSEAMKPMLRKSMSISTHKTI